MPATVEVLLLEPAARPAPFVGMFIARSSLGPTLRETVFSILGIDLFGVTAFHNELYRAGSIGPPVDGDGTLALLRIFALMDASGLDTEAAAVLPLLNVTYFINLTDSGTSVIKPVLAQGNPGPLLLARVSWGPGVGDRTGVLLPDGGPNAAICGGHGQTTVLGSHVDYGSRLGEALRAGDNGPRPARKRRLSQEPGTGAHHPRF